VIVAQAPCRSTNSKQLADLPGKQRKKRRQGAAVASTCCAVTRGALRPRWFGGTRTATKGNGADDKLLKLTPIRPRHPLTPPLQTLGQGGEVRNLKVMNTERPW